jgi:hypothetical protein
MASFIVYFHGSVDSSSGNGLSTYIHDGEGLSQHVSCVVVIVLFKGRAMVRPHA